MSLQAARDVEAAGRERPVDHAADVERRDLRVVGRDGRPSAPALVSSAAVSWVRMWVWVSMVRASAISSPEKHAASHARTRLQCRSRRTAQAPVACAVLCGYKRAPFHAPRKHAWTRHHRPHGNARSPRSKTTRWCAAPAVSSTTRACPIRPMPCSCARRTRMRRIVVGRYRRGARSAKGVLAVLTAADMKAAGLDSAGAPSAAAPAAAAKDADPAVPAGARRRTRALCRRSGGDGGRRNASARRRTPPIWSRSNTRNCRPVVDPRDAIKPGAPQLHPEAPGNLAIDWPGMVDERGQRARGRRRSSRARRMSRASRVVNQRMMVASMETRGATGVYDPKTDSYTLHACSQSAGTVRNQARADPRRAERQAARHHRRRRRRLRHEDAGLSGISGAAGRRQESRPAGALDVDALGSLHDRHAGARHGDRNRTRARRQRQIPRAAHAASVRPGRLCLARRRRHQHQQLRALPARHVPHSEDRFLVALLFHQHGADRPLSRRRPPGSELRARPRGRGSRAHHRHGHRAAAQEEPDPEIGDAVQDRGHHHLRQRRFPRRRSPRRWSLPTTTTSTSASASRPSARNCAASASPACSSTPARCRPKAPSLQFPGGDKLVLGAERAIDRTEPRHRVRPRAGARSSASTASTIEHRHGDIGARDYRASPRSARARRWRRHTPSCTPPT